MLQIHLFGHLRLFKQGKAIQFSALPKTLPLWVYLLLHRHTAVPRETLAYTLWDDVSESEARANLRRHLHDLSKALPPAPADTPWLLREGNTIRWNPAAHYWLDVAEFEMLSHDSQRLAEAITLYTGDLLINLYEDWIAIERERLQLTFFNILNQLVQRSKERHDPMQALVYVQQLLNQDPLREDALREIMTLRYQLGDRAGALQAYQKFKTRLDEELGVEPMPETAALFQLITSNKPLPDAPVSLPAKATTPLPSAAPTAAPPHNLPAQLNSFIGRERELQTLCDLFTATDGRTRLVTITGPGGTGKTRLSLEVAAWLVKQRPQRFPDGVFFVSLASLNDPDLVVTALAETIAVRERSGSMLKTLQTELQHKQILFVVDNFEHLLPAAAILATLLTAASGLYILVTSQAPLHLYGEHEFPLPPLPLPDPTQSPSLSDLSHYGAIALFVERVQAVQPSFALTESNKQAVLDICLRLDGIPLALELAAARSKLFTPAAMLAQLDNRLRFLTGRARNLAERQQTLRATIAWSYNLLEPDEQALFSRLAVFAGSFTLTAAHALISDTTTEPELFDLFEGLVDKNILRRLPQEGEETEPRFRMLQTLREYGLECLTTDPATAAAVYQQGGCYYADQIEEAELELRGQNQLKALRWYIHEDRNLLMIMDWLFQHAEEPVNGALAARLAMGMEHFWFHQGRFTEGKMRLEQALPYAPLLPFTKRLRLLNKAGGVAQWMGDYQTAVERHQMALELARAADDLVSVTHTLHFLGNAAGRQGDYQTARVTLEESLLYHRQLSDFTAAHIKVLLNNLAIVYKRLGNYERAETLLNESLTIRREEKDYISIAGALSNLGNLAVLRGHYEKARQLLGESLQIRHEVQDRLGLVSSLDHIAELAAVTGDYGRSTCLYAASQTYRTQMQVPLTADGRADFQRDMDLLKTKLDEQSFAQTWAAGAAMSMDDAVAYALEGMQLTAVNSP